MVVFSVLWRGSVSDLLVVLCFRLSRQRCLALVQFEYLPILMTPSHWWNFLVKKLDFVTFSEGLVTISQILSQLSVTGGGLCPRQLFKAAEIAKVSFVADE